MSSPADLSRLRVEGPAPTRARYCSASSSGTAAERLTDDLLLEMLPRVPAKSLCRFRCVSKHWLGLIDHPDHRKKLPQKLAGFFYNTGFTSSGPEKDFYLQPPIHLISVSGSPCPLTSISFAFLPNHMRVAVLHCCNGLFLCRCPCKKALCSLPNAPIVCNPATEKWVALPDSGQAIGDVLITRLGFDPAQSSHFHVFELLGDFDGWGRLAGVAVYWSETGEWVHKKERWNQHIMFRQPAWGDSGQTVFLNNHLYFLACRGSLECLAVVDMEGETWTNFGVPGDGLIEGFIQRSQGRLHYANFYAGEENNVPRLAVYALENYESKVWTLKHIIEASYLFRGTYVYLDCRFKWVGIHPECNSIFFTAGLDITLMCYNMDHQQVKVIRNLKNVEPPYLPYVPLYAELQSLHM
ncbi:hypothetical protein ACQ4PT_011049 [Festuca glaucescens]